MLTSQDCADHICTYRHPGLLLGYVILDHDSRRFVSFLVLIEYHLNKIFHSWC